LGTLKSHVHQGLFTYTKIYVSSLAVKLKSRMPQNDIFLRESFLNLNQ